MKMTPERIETFLAILSKTGSVAAAVKGSSPHLKSTDSYEKSGDIPGRSTWYMYRRANPDFAQRWDQALDDALSEVEEMIMKNALDPPAWVITDNKGNVVGKRSDTNSQNRLLLRVASKLSKNGEWNEKRQLEIEHNGSMDSHLQISHADALSLGPADQAELLRLLGVIEDKRKSEPDAKLVHEQHELIEGEAPDGTE